ncbi:MAG: PBP1A family penicillin-binding protein, partial [Nitrospinae bacterium]|nr:PBP1A family penicillin-binding protein [Nitrospinota bacterium]
NRILLSQAEIPDSFKKATIAVEDASFYEHGGVNPRGIMRAALRNILAGGVVEGGSTITQQLTKIMFLTPERTFSRKIKEAFLAIKIDRSFSKDDILSMYLNQIYYGHGSYGIEAAAKTYFGASANDLTLDEVALIVGLPKSPRRYSPYFSPERAKNRRNHVLRRMASLGYISENELNEYSNMEIVLREDREGRKTNAPYFTEYIRQYLEQNYGSKAIYESGLKVYTTLKLDYQAAAEESLKRGIEEVDRRLGYRGPLGHITIGDAGVDWAEVASIAKEEYDPADTVSFTPDNILFGVVKEVTPRLATIYLNGAVGKIALSDMRWAHLRNREVDAVGIPDIDSIEGIISKGDIIKVKIVSQLPDGAYSLSLFQDMIVEGSLASIDPKTGYIRAMVGGYDFAVSQFNRAAQAKRQPGSAFKPLIYSAAFEYGYSPASIFIDSPIIFDNTEADQWKPENFEKRFYGAVSLRDALTHSRNVVTVKLLKSIGIKYAVDYVKRFKIDSEMTPDLSLALGTSTITPLELTSVYGVFANGGIMATPMAVKEITDSKGNVIESNKPVLEQVISPENAFMTTSVLQNVVQEGTGWQAKGLNRPVGAKTGTTNEFVDAWFVGYVPQLVTGVWIGIDYGDSLGKNETGSRAASPIWLDFMKKVLENQPVETFKMPDGLVFKRVNKNDGLLTLPNDTNYTFEPFVIGKEPQDYSKEAEAGRNRLKL